jgi:hypothetical protein
LAHERIAELCCPRLHLGRETQRNNEERPSSVETSASPASPRCVLEKLFNVQGCNRAKSLLPKIRATLANYAAIVFAGSNGEFLMFWPHVEAHNHFLLPFDFAFDSSVIPWQTPVGGKSAQTHRVHLDSLSNNIFKLVSVVIFVPALKISSDRLRNCFS